jgi:hypothetical protein
MPTLPSWLVQQAPGVFQIDPDVVYPSALRMLGVKLADRDQYWIETAYQCARMAAQALILGTGLDPAPAPLVLLIDGSDGRKERWALTRFRPGRGAGAVRDVASLAEASEAKIHYRAIGAHLRAGTEPPGLTD